MQRQHYFYKRITVDPEVCFGKPCIRELRMPVVSVLDYLSSGMNTEELLKEFNFLEKEDILEALAFSSVRMEEWFVQLGEAS